MENNDISDDSFAILDKAIDDTCRRLNEAAALRENYSQILAERDGSIFIANNLSADNDALRKENRMLREYNMAAAKDTNRLEWLAMHTYYPNDHPDIGVFAIVSKEASPEGDFCGHTETDYFTFRMAIDAAMAKESEASHA